MQSGRPRVILQLEAPIEYGLSQLVMTFDAEIENVKLQDETGQLVNVLETGSLATVVMDVCFHKDVSQPIFSLTIRTPDGKVIYDTTTKWKNIRTPDFTAGEKCSVEFNINLPLLEGEYHLSVDVAAADYRHYYDRLEHALGFWIKSTNEISGAS